MKFNEWVCIAANNVSGVSTWAMFDDEGVTIQERQDVTKLLDENMAIRNVSSDNWKGEGLYSVARVPLAMAHEKGSYIADAIKESDTKVINRVLNDIDYSKLRTKGGQL